VAEVVKAYYDAGSRPASHLKSRPEPSVEIPDEAPAASAEPEARFEPEPAPMAVAAFAETAYPDTPEHAGPVHKSLAELADELEAFIEVIRYGDDLGSTARS